jgi:hypothetical protein
MPTLIRLIVALLFLAGLAFAAAFALTIFVDPGEKEITVKIPPRQLVATPQPAMPPAADTQTVPASTQTVVPAGTQTATGAQQAPIAPGADQGPPE